MRKRKLRIITLTVCFALIFGVAACGGASQSPAEKVQSAVPGEQDETFVWKGEFVDIEIKEDDEFSFLLFAEDGVYVSQQENVGRLEVPEGQVEEYDGQFDLYAPAIWFYDFSGHAEKLDAYTPPPAAEYDAGVKDFYSYSDIVSLVRKADGNLVALEVTGAGWFDGPDPVYGTDEMYEGEYIHYEESYSVANLGPDGTVLSRATVDLDLADSWMGSANAAVDGDGNLILAVDDTLIAIAPDGSAAWTIRCDDSVSDLITLADGSVAATAYAGNGMMLYPVDCSARKLGKGIAVPESFGSYYAGDGEYDLYYASGLYLYGIRLGEKEGTEVLNWAGCDIDSNSIDLNTLHISQDGAVRGLTFDYSADTPAIQLFTLSKVPADTMPEKEVLTIARLEYYQDLQLDSRIVQFNRTHDNVRIEYKDYSEYAAEDADVSEGMTRFMTELMAGNAPDIIPTQYLSYQQLAAKGMLEDLYPYIDADPVLKREDFFPNVLSMLEVDGGLYQIVPGFSVQTLMGAANIVGNTPGWNYAEFYEALAKMPEGCLPLGPDVTRDDILYALLYANMDHYVDWSTGEVSFDSDDFRELLEFAKQFPLEYDSDNEDNESTEELVRQGRQMLEQVELYSLEAVMSNDINFGGESTFIGWPVTEGIGSIMKTDNGYAISSKCADKDLAWEFIRSMLTEDGQKTIYSIPINRKVFERQIQDLMTVHYEKDENGKYRLDENGERIIEPRSGWMDETGQEHFVYAMTQKQADDLLYLVENCTRIANYDTSISTIVREQVQAYFADQKSLDEVCRLIQSRASIYINEQN